jgi:acyl-CoA synthetase (NDP forming)/GNAT superfamily N-acetyltransferase
MTLMDTTRDSRFTRSAVPQAVDVLLADGTVGRIRSLLPTDRAALIRLHEAASDESLRRRFFTVSRTAGRTYAEHLCDEANGSSEVIALTAFVADELVAVASAEPVAAGTAEVAFMVADHAHGLGLGTLLIEHLAAAAREHGVRCFVAEVLSDNSPMLRVFQDCGFSAEHTTEGGVQSLRLDTAATARAVAAADQRECHAEARSLEPLLYPRSVAVVGARRDGSGVGHAVLRAIRSGNFSGEVHVVHPTLSEVDGVPAVSSFAQLDPPVDLAVIAVPAKDVIDAAREAAAAGIRAAVVLSSGFGEMGAEGAQLQRQLVQVARQHSMRLVGPNCLGVMATDPAISLNATFAGSLPEPGGLAIASQSGGVGIALLDHAREVGLGVSSFVSLGNKADVSGNDLLAAWLDDDRVTAAALYLESFGNARKFARIARRFAEHKPILAVVGGRSESGRRGGASHTAAAAAPAVGIDALFTQAGVISCDSLESITSTALLLTEQPLPAGSRVGIVGNAGGLGILAADAATAAGLVVPALSPDLRARLSGATSGTDGVSNPVDLGAAPDPPSMLTAARAVLESDEVDALLLVLVATAASDVGSFLGPFAAVRQLAAEKPVVLVTHGAVQVPPESVDAFARLRSVELAADALGRAASYARWRATPTVDERPAVPHTPTAVRELVSRLMHATSRSQGWLSAPESRELLAAYGVDSPPASVVNGVAEAVMAANRLGYPVVLKAADPALVHKSDRHLVRVGLGSPTEVHAAVSEIGTELGDPMAPLLVQTQVEPGTEMALGIVRDPAFGPLIMVAAGGVTTDVLADRAFLVPPLTPMDASRALRSLRLWPLLTGFRGAAPADVDALIKLVVAVGDLALDVPEIAELDLNPVMVWPTGVSSVDAKIRLSEPVGPQDAGVPRSLRPPV